MQIILILIMIIKDNFFQRFSQFILANALGISPYKYINSYLKVHESLNDFDFINNLYKYVIDNEFTVTKSSEPVFAKHPFHFFDLRYGNTCDFALFFLYLLKYFRPELKSYVLLVGNTQGEFVATCFVKLMPCICFSIGSEGCFGPVPSVNEVINKLMSNHNYYFVLDKDLTPLVIDYKVLNRDDL